MSTTPNTTMSVFRIIGGRRIPYIFELDSEMTVITDKPDYEAIRAESRAQAGLASGDASLAVKSAIERAQASGGMVVTSAPEILATNPELAIAEQVKTGIVSETQLPGGGKAIVYNPTALDIKVGEWVTPMIKTNPIDGTDELRAEFFAAEEAIKAKHAADGTVCKPCELGALIRKYRAKLESLGHLK